MRTLKQFAIIDNLNSFLEEVDDDFSPRLSSRIQLDAFASKIWQRATILTIYEKSRLSAFAAIYCDDKKRKLAYLTMIAVSKHCRGRGIARTLMRSSILYLRELRFSTLRLEVYKNNVKAIRIYQNLDFVVVRETSNSLIMDLALI